MKRKFTHYLRPDRLIKREGAGSTNEQSIKSLAVSPKRVPGAQTIRAEKYKGQRNGALYAAVEKINTINYTSSWGSQMIVIKVGSIYLLH